MPPRDAALEHTSGWANFFGERDTSARIKEAARAETEAGEMARKEVVSVGANGLKTNTQKQEGPTHGEK